MSGDEQTVDLSADPNELIAQLVGADPEQLKELIERNDQVRALYGAPDNGKGALPVGAWDQVYADAGVDPKAAQAYSNLYIHESVAALAEGLGDQPARWPAQVGEAIGLAFLHGVLFRHSLAQE